MGELNDEYPTKRITGFWSPGPKQYLITFEDKVSKEKSHIMKIRGLTLNEETENTISIKKFKEMVEGIGIVDEDKNPFKNTNQKIGPDDYGKVYTR